MQFWLRLINYQTYHLWVFHKMDPVFFIKSAKNGSFYKYQYTNKRKNIHPWSRYQKRNWSCKILVLSKLLWSSLSPPKLVRSFPILLLLEPWLTLLVILNTELPIVVFCNCLKYTCASQICMIHGKHFMAWPSPTSYLCNVHVNSGLLLWSN